jgi:uncharacterized protein DUF4124
MTNASPARGAAAALLLTVLSVLPPAARAQVYKCPQANGTIGYQGTPCPGGARQAMPEPPGAASGPAPATSSLVADVQARNRRDNERQAWLDAHSHDKTPASMAACNAARHNLGVLREQRPVYSYDKKGNRVFVEDQDRAATIAATERSIADNCN